MDSQVGSVTRPGATAIVRRQVTDATQKIHDVPISRLPVELLIRILQLYAADQQPWTRSLGWIRVTHVCRFWRNALLDHPMMWSNIIPNLGPRWLELMLDRTRSTPFSYYQLNYGQRSEQFLSHVIPHLNRLRSLELQDSPDSLETILQSFASPAPMLHNLDLYTKFPRLRCAVFPEEIFQNKTPMLRQLRLTDVCLSWSASILRGLTYLYLVQESDHRRPFIQEDNFFHALDGIPSLEVLFLEHVLPHGPHGDGHTTQLPCLWSLTLIDDSPRCHEVFERLNVPSSCRLDIQLECEDERPDFDNVLPLFCGQFPAKTDYFHTLSIVRAEGCVMGLKLWRASKISESGGFPHPGYPDLFLTLFPLVHDEEFSEYIGIMCDALPLDNIRVIITSECNSINAIIFDYDWERFFARNCQKIRHILVNKGVNAHELCKALATTFDNGLAREGKAHERIRYGPCFFRVSSCSSCNPWISDPP